MRWAAPALALIACGGSPPPRPAPPPPPPPRPTRVMVETDSEAEPEDGMQVVAAHGHMEQAAVEAGLAPHTADLMACYTSRVGRRRWLGGHVVLHWDIARDGTITKVLLSESDLGAWPVEKCLLDVARGATFDKPVGGDADFQIPLDFSAKGAILAWDEDQGEKAVGKQLARLDACSKSEPPPDDVTVTAYVGPHGKVQSVGFSSGKSEIGDRWAECASKAVVAWKLPDPRGTIAKLAIRYRAR